MWTKFHIRRQMTSLEFGSCWEMTRRGACIYMNNPCKSQGNTSKEMEINYKRMYVRTYARTDIPTEGKTKCPTSPSGWETSFFKASKRKMVLKNHTLHWTLTLFLTTALHHPYEQPRSGPSLISMQFIRITRVITVDRALCVVSMKSTSVYACSGPDNNMWD